MSAILFPLISTIALYSICRSQTCPNDTLFVTCKDGGLQDSSSCYSPTVKVIAYGWNPYWAYYEKAAGVDLPCENSVFGNPYAWQTKICCKLQNDLSGVSGLSPVVNTISCDETKHDYFKEGVSSTTHFWKFTLGEASLVTIENCNTLYDTKMYLRNSTGDRVSDSDLGCVGGDDCNCGWLQPNEKFIDVSLSAGDYYIEILPYDSSVVGGAGTYYLSTACAAAPAPIMPPTSSPTTPTNIPTLAPTNTLSSAPTTPLPTGSPKTFCGKTYTVWCYDIDLYPSLTTETNYTVFITNPQDNVATYFQIEATIHGNHCVNPSILFSFEEIDFSQNYPEHIYLYDNDLSHLATCYGTEDKQCGHWIDCFDAPQPLGTNKINQGETYSIYIEESPYVDALCTQYHPYSMNAKLTIICSGNSASPTEFPTADPTPGPSSAPSSPPSNAPSSAPSSAPSAPPTSAPSSTPTLDPTNAPSTDPSNAPSANPTSIPTDIPSETPTKKPILAVHPSAPTSLPTSSPTDHEAEVRDTDGDSDDTDGDDEQSEQDAADKEDQKENTFVVMIAASISLFAVCCVLIVCIYYQCKKGQKLTNNALAQQKSADSLQLAVHAPVAMDTLNAGAKRQSYASVASDTHAADAITPMGVVVHHEPGDSYADNDGITLPRLPSENVGNQTGEKDELSGSDGEEDHEDLYIAPAKRHTKGGRTAGDDYDQFIQPKTSGDVEDGDLDQAEDEEGDDDDDDDDEHNDLYEKPTHQNTAGNANDGINNEESVDSVCHSDDEHDDLYGKPKDNEGDNDGGGDVVTQT